MKTYLYHLYQWIIKGIPIVKVPVLIYKGTDSQRLQGRKIIVTGGNKGIGYKIAECLHSYGAEVILVGRDEKQLKAAAQELSCQYIQYDLTNTAEMSELIKKASFLLGGDVDALINNAGVCNVDKGFLNVSEDSYDEQFQTNVKSPFFLTQAFLRHIEENKVSQSDVIFITSERGLYPDDAPYGMTKAAIGNIIAGIARKFATKGVRVNGIAPGVVANTAQNPEVYDDAYLKGSIGKRYILPEEIAETVAFLLSNASMCISGEIITCNMANHYK